MRDDADAYVGFSSSKSKEPNVSDANNSGKLWAVD